MERAAPRRRLWLRLTLTAFVVVVGARIAWHFRPLNAGERKLIGNWGVYVHQLWGRGLTHDGWPVDGVTLTADRRFSIHLDCQSDLRLGSWRVAGNELFLKYDVPFDWVTFPQRLVDLVMRNNREERYNVEFKQADVIQTHRSGQDENTWIRSE